MHWVGYALSDIYEASEHAVAGDAERVAATLRHSQHRASGAAALPLLPSEWHYIEQSKHTRTICVDTLEGETLVYTMDGLHIDCISPFNCFCFPGQTATNA